MQVLKTLRRNRLETGALTVAAVSVAVAAVNAAVAVVNAAFADSHFAASSATFVFVFAAAVANCN